LLTARRCGAVDVEAVRQHRDGALQRVLFAVHGDAAERAFRAAIDA
jgi:hypothetical protein